MSWEEDNQRALYLENRKKQLEEIRLRGVAKAKLNMRMMKAKCVEYLGGKCKRCNQVFPNCAYDFHHRDPAIKDRGIASMMGRNWNNIVNELDKCDLLCACCHRITHYELTGDE